MKKYCLLLLGLCCFVPIHAQSVIDKYIREGLDNNESIKQQTFLLKKNLYALKEAQSLFFPKLIVSGSYNKADGGRTVDFLSATYSIRFTIPLMNLREVNLFLLWKIWRYN